MRKSRKVALIAACVAGGTVLLAVGAAIVLTGGANTPEPVPSGWTRPVALPVSAPLAADRFAFDSDRTGSFEVFTAGTDGGSPVQLTSDPVYDSWSPRVSPDRRTILFYRAPAGKHDLDQSIVSLWAIAADGSGPVELRPAGLDGWVLQGHAEWAPDARTLVMFGGSRINPQIQITDALGQGPHAITDRGGTNLDPSFSPDGTQVVFVGCAQSICREPDYEIYRIPVAGGEATRLTDDSLRDQDPYFSPDGTRLAWLTAFGGEGVGVWDVRIGDAQGRNPVRLFGDDGITSRPAFTADSASIFVHRIPPGGARFDVYRIGVDGTGATSLTADQPGNNEYPSP